MAPDDLENLIIEINKLQNLELRGLMAIAPLISQDETRPYFRKMKTIYDKTGLAFLSMGMTNDFEAAISEGSNMVRIGRAIFG